MDNVELVRRFAQAFNERDIDRLLDLTSPDLEFVPYLASLIERTVYRGHDGVRRYFEDADAAWESIEVRLDEVRDVDDRTISSGKLHGKGRASGLEVRVPLWWVATIREGKLALLQTYESEEEALQAVEV